MNIKSPEDLKGLIRDVPDFPKKGIIFKDITPILKDPGALAFAVDELADFLEEAHPDPIVGIESRGFILSPILAYKLKAGFVPVRKKGKLPAETIRVSYDLEKLGGEVVAVAFLVELAFLKGREKLTDYNVFSLIRY